MQCETAHGLVRLIGPSARIGAAALFNLSVVPVVLLHMPVLTFLFLACIARFFMGLSLFISRRGGPAFDWFSVPLIMVLSLFLFFDGLFFFLGAIFLPLGLSVMILSLAPVITLSLEAMLRLQPPRPSYVLSSVVCLAGAAIAFEPWTGGTGSTLGYFTASVSSLCDALIPFIVESLKIYGVEWQDQLPLLAMCQLFCAYPAIAIAAALALGSINEIFRPADSLHIIAAYPAIVISSAVGQAVAAMLFNVAYAVVPDLSVSAVATFTELIFAIIVQVTILKEPASYYQLAGALLVFIGLTGLTYGEIREQLVVGNHELPLHCTRFPDQQTVPLLGTSATQVTSVSGLKLERGC